MPKFRLFLTITAFALVAVMAGHWLGGGAALGRIDAALLVPTLAFAAIPLVLILGNAIRPAALAVAAAIAVMIVWTIFAATRSAALASALALPQMALLGAGAVIITGLLALMRAALRYRAGWLTVMVMAIAGSAWWFASHAALAFAYAVPLMPDRGRTVLMTGLPLFNWSDPALPGAGREEAAAVQVLRHRLGGAMTTPDALDPTSLQRGDRLLLAHPRPLDPASLVAIDAFVRGGGRAVILADGLSGWPHAYPLGDARNPPLTSLLTPLLDRWGVVLEAPQPGGAAAGMISVRTGSYRLQLHSPGYFSAYPSNCRKQGQMPGNRAVLIECRVGAGTAVLLADADLLFDPLWRPDPLWASHLRVSDNIEWLAAALNDSGSAPRWGLRPTWQHPAPGND